MKRKVGTWMVSLPFDPTSIERIIVPVRHTFIQTMNQWRPHRAEHLHNNLVFGIWMGRESFAEKTRAILAAYRLKRTVEGNSLVFAVCRQVVHCDYNESVTTNPPDTDTRGLYPVNGSDLALSQRTCNRTEPKHNFSKVVKRDIRSWAHQISREPDGVSIQDPTHL